LASEGDRVFGFLPISAFLALHVGDATQTALTDASEHRRHLPAVYRTYLRTKREDANQEDVRSLCLDRIRSVDAAVAGVGSTAR
jgi:Protein of unknown function (DUF2855)